MTLLGAINSATDMTTEEAAPILDGYDTATGQSTTAAALEDIPGLTFDLVLTTAGRISAIMTVECSLTGTPASTVGGWAVSIAGSDGTEIQRHMDTIGDPGALAVQFRNDTPLSAGTYTVKGRHRRVSGSNTVNTDKAQLSAHFVE